MSAPTNTPLRVVLAGQVDHGKSTLVARLLLAAGRLSERQMQQLEEYSRSRGTDLEISFLLDALKLERDQAVTVDACQAVLRLEKREVRLVDVPGHVEFLRNMITGAAGAEAAILVVDASEGVREQTLRHLRLLGLLGLTRVVVAVNKMDLMGYERAPFELVRHRVLGALRDLGMGAAAVIPVSARHGDLFSEPSPRMPWYAGPTFIEALSDLEPAVPVELPPRLAVQDVYRVGDERVIVGRLESGRLRVGDDVVFLPGGQSSRIRSFPRWPSEAADEVFAGQAVAMTLVDDVVVQRGDLACRRGTSPSLAQRLSGLVFWLGSEPLAAGQALQVKMGTRTVSAVVHSIDTVTDLNSLLKVKAESLCPNEIGRVTFAFAEPVAADTDAFHSVAGRAVLLHGFDTVGGLVWITPGEELPRAGGGDLLSFTSHVTEVQRQRRLGHRGGVLWLTGLSGAGKTTVSVAAEARLFEAGYLTFLLDGDMLRSGLSADLGFSPGDRAEQVRRVAHVAAMIARTGAVCLVALISPYRSDRSRARDVVGPSFREVFVSADVDVCEQRDPKGLYRRARQGEIPNFTGVSAPYEVPECPDLIIDTAREDAAASIEQLVSYVRRVFPLSDHAPVGDEHSPSLQEPVALG